MRIAAAGVDELEARAVLEKGSDHAFPVPPHVVRRDRGMEQRGARRARQLLAELVERAEGSLLFLLKSVQAALCAPLQRERLK